MTSLKRSADCGAIEWPNDTKTIPNDPGLGFFTFSVLTECPGC